MPRETFLVAYNELQRSCSEQQQQQQRVFPDPCVEYSKPWKLNSKSNVATSAAGFESRHSGLSGTPHAAREEREEREEARQSLHMQLTSPRRRGTAVVAAAVLVFLVVCRSQPGAAMRLRRKLRRCICSSASKQALQPSKQGNFVL